MRPGRGTVRGSRRAPWGCHRKGRAKLPPRNGETPMMPAAYYGSQPRYSVPDRSRLLA